MANSKAGFRISALVLLAVLAGVVRADGAGTVKTFSPPYPVVGSIERLDPALDEVLAPEAVIERVAAGFRWPEGPVWVVAEGALLFSDVPEDVVYRWREGAGVEVYVKPSGHSGEVERGSEPGSNGLTLDREGRLLLCQHGDRRVARLEADRRSFATVVDRWEGKRFNSPNDLCVDRAGNLFFTDPPYGLPREELREIDFNGVYRLSNDGNLSVVARDLTRPNGVALSPDERTLYVANSDDANPVIMAYAIAADGTAGAGRVFWDNRALIARTGRSGAADGLRVDARRNLWATGPGGVLVISPQGRHLGSILTERPNANVAFGGPDGKTLFIVAWDALLRVETLTRGADGAR